MSASSAPEFSVIVCTRNRSRSLERCLRAALVEDPGFPCETIVVDNGSTDDTRGRVEALRGHHPDLRYVCEPKVGLSHARNCGAAAASAPLLAYLDDDAEPAPGWLAALRAAFSETGTAMVGGPILPRYEATPPHWLAAPHLGFLSCQDFGAERRRVTEFPYLFGANLAVRRADLERAGGFDPRFGRSGEDLTSGEDTLLCERVLANGGTILYEPRAVVYHWIPAERLTKHYFHQRALATGRTRMLQASAHLSPSRLAALLAGKALKLPVHLMLWAAARTARDRDGAARSERSVFVTLGMLRHALGPDSRARAGRTVIASSR